MIGKNIISFKNKDVQDLLKREGISNRILEC